jgi:hypothetical protein
MQKAIAVCRKELPPDRKVAFGADELKHYYYAQVMFVAGGKDWFDYSNSVFEQLKSAQDKDGSWRSSKGIGEGRVYATAIWCIILQLQSERHPSMKHALPQRIF